MPKRVSPILLPIAMLTATVLSGCNENGAQKSGKGPPPAPAVTVAHPVQKVVSDYDEFVGRFVAYNYVEVRARVSGYLDKIHFDDGQDVAVGDTLFSIDKRPFESALAQAKAALSEAEANLSFAESQLQRGEELKLGTTITRQTFDQRVQAKRVAQAEVASKEAAIKQAELDLAFTELKAPVAGRIGDHRVSVGNLVTGGTAGNTTLLATIVSRDPIRFEFTLDEAAYLDYLKAFAKRGNATASQSPVPVSLKLIGEDDFGHRGKIDFVDNALDRSSGTIRMRAEFANSSGAFTPGMFGRIRLPTGAPATALLVPDTAIGTEQVRKFVFTVGSDNIAKPKYVTLGPVIDGLRVVTAGLDMSDTIVVNGLMRIRPGTKVTPQQATADAGAQTTPKPRTD